MDSIGNVRFPINSAGHKTMLQRRKILLGLLLLGLVVGASAGWLCYAQTQSPAYKKVMRGSRVTSDTLGVSSGNLVLVAPRPGVFFGTVTKPGSQEQMTFLLLFRDGRPWADSSGQVFQSHCTSDGKFAETKDVLELGGKRFEAEYRVELNQAGTAVAEEHLLLGGKRIDLAAGSVFLVDLTAKTLTYQQQKVELPAIPSPLESPEDVERLVETIRSDLIRQSPEIEAFLK